MITLDNGRFAMSPDGASTLDVITGTRFDDRLDGTSHADTISGLGGDDILQGLSGADSLAGGGGDDTLLGGSGNDTLVGGNGHDLLQGGSGDDLFLVGSVTLDIIDGGLGFDTVSFASVDHGLTIDLIDGKGSANSSGIEGIIGTAFDDFIIGARSPSLIDGEAGDDELQSRRGGSTLVGGDGDDQLFCWRGAGDDLRGGDGDDFILAGQLDVVDGGAGRDHILLAVGRTATLSGGAGADLFEFHSPAHRHAAADLITDLANDDRIDISGIDADPNTGGDQAFTLVAALDGHAGEAALAYDPRVYATALLLDIDGDGMADFTIRLRGDHTGFSNFVL